MTMQQFKPILFSTEMVQAILAGRKNQTRRILKCDKVSEYPDEWQYRKFGGMAIGPHTEYHHQFLNEFGRIYEDVQCPYGSPGTILWVRETFMDISGHATAPIFLEVNEKFVYKADDFFIGCHNWQPGIHMPKTACRLFLKIENVKVERLWNISEQDAKAEGAEAYTNMHPDIHLWKYKYPTHRTGFAGIWIKINGIDSWKANPWLWVIDFKKVERPADFLSL